MYGPDCFFARSGLLVDRVMASSEETGRRRLAAESNAIAVQRVTVCGNWLDGPRSDGPRLSAGRPETGGHGEIARARLTQSVREESASGCGNRDMSSTLGAATLLRAPSGRWQIAP